MKIWHSGDAIGAVPPGHYGGLTVADAISRTDSDGLFTVQLSTCPPGGGGLAHQHDADMQVFYVISGSLSFEAGGDRFDIGPGQAVLFSPGEAHATHNHTDSASTALVITVSAQAQL